MDLYFCLKVLTFVLQYECMSVFVRWQVFFFVYLLTPSLPIPQLQCHMQTAWIRMRSRINRRLVQIHVIWQSINQWICEVKMKQTIFFPHEHNCQGSEQVKYLYITVFNVKNVYFTKWLYYWGPQGKLVLWLIESPSLNKVFNSFIHSEFLALSIRFIGINHTGVY